MCLAKETESPKKEVASPRSPWAKLLNRQNRPRLPRNVASSARVNLNKCWTKLEKLMSNSSPKDTLRADDEPLLIPFTDVFFPVDPVKPVAENEISNLSHRFELIPEGLEVTDNMKNEVREICYSNKHSNCSVCKLCF